MRRIIANVPLYVLLFAGCADHDDDSGFTTHATEPGSTTGSPMSTSEASAGADAGTAGSTSTGMTGAVSGSPGGTPTESGVSGEASTGDSDATTGTTTTGTMTGASGESAESGDTTTGDMTTGTTGEDTAGAHSFAVDIWPIFEDRCSCHDDANGAGKLRLAMEDAYTNMVDKPSNQAPMMMLVKPGSAEESYLWHKLNDTQDDVGGKGKKMPPSGKLKAAELELIQLWIDEGAKP